MSDVSQPSTIISFQSAISPLVAAGVLDERINLPFNAELLNATVASVTGPAGAAGTFDVLVGGVSIYGGTIANLTQAITTTSTVVYVSKVAGVGNLVANQIIKIGTEVLKVTAVNGAAGQVGVGGGTSQSTISNDPNMLALSVVRAQYATTAAVAAVNAAVLAVGPTIADGSSDTGTIVAGPSSQNINAGSIITLKVLAVGSGTAGAKPSVALHFAKR